MVLKMNDKLRFNHIHIKKFYKKEAKSSNKIPIVLTFIVFVIMLASSPMSVMNFSFYKIANAQNNSFNNGNNGASLPFNNNLLCG